VAGGTRVLVSIVAVIAAAVVAAAALAAPGDPKLAIKPADQARAKAFLLKAAELPGTGWTGTAVDFGRANPLCLTKRYSLSTLTVNAQTGQEFTRSVDVGTFLVDSAVRTFVTPKQAADAVVIRSDIGVGKCLGRALAAEAPNGSVTTSTADPFSIKGLALPSKGFLITVKVIAGGQKSKVTAVVLSFHHGRTVNELNVLTLGRGWSNAKLRSVAAIIAKRTATAR
jgi:hypothetical protein